MGENGGKSTPFEKCQSITKTKTGTDESSTGKILRLTDRRWAGRGGGRDRDGLTMNRLGFGSIQNRLSDKLGRGRSVLAEKKGIFKYRKNDENVYDFILLVSNHAMDVKYSP